MKIRGSMLAVSLAVLSAASAPVAGLAGDDEAAPAVTLSPGLTALLRAEMAQLAGGVTSIALALPAADWAAIADSSAKMRDSYIMKKSLTETQAAELKQKLPQQFKHLDAVFHARAEKLGEAARTRDMELVVFRYARLLETCAECHSAYAAHRFPGFAGKPEVEQGH